MNIRQTLNSAIGEISAAGFKGRKPGSGSKIKGLNSHGLIEEAKKMWGDGSDFGIHMERAMRSEAPHMTGPMKFESLTKTQRRNVAKGMYSTAQQRTRAARMKLKASPGAGVYGGGPGSGRHKGGGAPKRHEGDGKPFAEKAPDYSNVMKHLKESDKKNPNRKFQVVKAGGPGSGPRPKGERPQVEKDQNSTTRKLNPEFFKKKGKSAKPQESKSDSTSRHEGSRRKPSYHQNKKRFSD